MRVHGSLQVCGYLRQSIGLCASLLVSASLCESVGLNVRVRGCWCVNPCEPVGLNVRVSVRVWVSVRVIYKQAPYTNTHTTPHPLTMHVNTQLNTMGGGGVVRSDVTQINTSMLMKCQLYPNPNAHPVQALDPSKEGERSAPPDSERDSKSVPRFGFFGFPKLSGGHQFHPRFGSQRRGWMGGGGGNSSGSKRKSKSVPRFVLDSRPLVFFLLSLGVFPSF